MAKATKAASDLEEAHAKALTVYEGHQSTLNTLTKELTDNYAMSRREAFANLAAMQDLLVPMGMASEKAAEMSGEVVKLSADLGSFNNLPTSQVMLDIQSALVGNFETMKKYGVVLNETVVKEEARARGLHTGKGLLDAQVKAEVAYQLIVKGSQAALGDMERTADGWANTMKDLGAKWEDFMASLGKFIIKAPIVHSWLKGVKIILADIAEALGGPQTKEAIEAQIEHYEKLQKEAKSYGETATAAFSESSFYSAQSNKNTEDYTEKLKELRTQLKAVEADEAAKATRAKAETDARAEDEKDKARATARAEATKEQIAGVEERSKQAEAALTEFERNFEKNWDNISKEAEAERDRRIKFTADTISLEAKIDADREEKHQAELKRIAERKAAQNAYLISVMFGTAQMLGAFAGLNEQLKGNAELTKTLARGEVAINTAAGIMKAYAQGGVLGFVTGAAIAAEGLRQLSVINAQKFALGGDFTTRGPQMIMVGDNPGGVERVQVTPISSPNVNGPQGANISMGDVYISGNADAGTVQAIKETRESQMRELRGMIEDLIFSRQMPRMT
jgi:hypothetical protein